VNQELKTKKRFERNSMLRTLMFVLFLTSPLHAGERFEVIEKRDIAYRDDAEAHPVKHKLDLFLPKGAKDFPVLIFVHGGTWKSGDKQLYSPLGHLFAQQGIGTVVVNYRLTTGTKPAKHPDHIQDVARAFAWVQENIEKHGGRKDRLFLGGHSAGGHLVSLLATDESYLKAEKHSISEIRGVIPISGVYHINPILSVFHPAFSDDIQVCRKASPIMHVHEGLPPFLVMYADKDLPTLDRMAADMHKKLQAKKCESDLLCVKGRDHTTIILFLALDEKDPCTQAMLEFVKKRQ
jgi:acetyl esterase/lipase